MHVLDADNLLPELDAAKFSATKVTQDPATIVNQKAKINKGIYAVTVITLDCGSTVGLTHFKYFQNREMIVLMVAAKMFTYLKQKFVKCEVITHSCFSTAVSLGEICPFGPVQLK